MSTDNLTADVFAKILPAGRDRALMRAALRLLAHGTPVTVTELAAAAGVPDLDPAQTPIGADVEYDEAAVALKDASKSVAPAGERGKTSIADQVVAK
ncbi:hypothetical protein ACWDNR_22795, partial [Gordonia aichiensis]